MTSIKNIFKILLMTFWLNVHAVENYQAVYPQDGFVDYHRLYSKALGAALKKIEPLLTEAMAASGGDPVQEAKAAEALISELDIYIHGYPSTPLQMQSPQGRLPLPALFVNPTAFSILMDGSFVLDQLEPNERQALAMHMFSVKWSYELRRQSEQVINQLVEERGSYPPDQYDMMRFMLLDHNTPKYDFPMSKAVWSRLHKSHNSIHRLMALDKFDAVEQTPSELLALYSECFFGACSYLEIRALEAILRNQDFRPEVVALLEKYLASNPPVNDGTIPNNRIMFQSTKAGADQVLKTIRDYLAQNPAGKMPVQALPQASNAATDNHQDRSGTPVPASKPAKLSRDHAAIANEEAASSTAWMVIVSWIVVASGLLCFLFKKQENGVRVQKIDKLK